MTRSVLLSVRPRFARALLDGSKTVEVRRRFPILERGIRLFVYSSSPDRAVLGTVIVSETSRIPADEVWDRYKRHIAIEREPLREYLEGAPHSVVLEVVEPQRWATPVRLATLRHQLDLEPAGHQRLTGRKHEEQQVHWRRP